MYYLKDLKENTTAPPLPVALPLPLPEQSLITQKPSQDGKVPAGAEKEKKGEMVASRTKEKAKEKRKEKAKNKDDANPSKDAFTIGDMVSKTKATESKSKIDSKKDYQKSQT